jgi:hypothetical protein
MSRNLRRERSDPIHQHLIGLTEGSFDMFLCWLPGQVYIPVQPRRLTWNYRASLASGTGIYAPWLIRTNSIFKMRLSCGGDSTAEKSAAGL